MKGLDRFNKLSYWEMFNKKSLKKTAAIVLSAMMMMTMAACGSGDKDADIAQAAPTPTKQAEGSGQVAEVPTIKPLNGGDEEVTEENHEHTIPEPADMSEINSIIPGKVEVSGSDFVVGDEVIFFNGVNTPWDKWNDFGGSFNEEFWSTHFATLHETGINATRIWISCNGDVAFDIIDGGYVYGVSEKYWQDLDVMFKCAEENGIYVMATIMSFDHFKDSNKTYENWRWMVKTDETIDSYVDNFLIPFCERYDDYDSLWSIDLCNEPDWIKENSECGNIGFDVLGKLFAKEAAAIHEHSDILVTIGFGMIKYNSLKYEGDYGSDEFLQSCYDNDNAYLDFNSTHFYEWESEWFGFPFDKDPTSFGDDASKPAVVGEFPATGFTDKSKNSKEMSGSDCYVAAYENGWDGCMAWTSNGVDKCGSLSDFEDGAKEVAEKMAK